jgi:hypothetical protein
MITWVLGYKDEYIKVVQESFFLKEEKYRHFLNFLSIHELLRKNHILKQVNINKYGFWAISFG